MSRKQVFDWRRKGCELSIVPTFGEGISESVEDRRERASRSVAWSFGGCGLNCNRTMSTFPREGQSHWHSSIEPACNLLLLAPPPLPGPQSNRVPWHCKLCMAWPSNFPWEWRW
eukprot:scaffold38584_cov31-Tisochrysis_lutea.AAC.6